ncbi:MAG TPA: hypothetical protein VFV38_02610 [Ktedonobacteraceae bacterium]|nr:hypothetical protein [Ktedonobacteraceae bacterium]
MTHEAKQFGAWQPWQPEDVASFFSSLTVPWWIAGGWTLDLFLGVQTRAHEDIDVLFLRRDQHEIRAASWVGCARGAPRAPTQPVAFPGMETGRASPGFGPRHLVPPRRSCSLGAPTDGHRHRAGPMDFSSHGTDLWLAFDVGIGHEGGHSLSSSRNAVILQSQGTPPKGRGGFRQDSPRSR